MRCKHTIAVSMHPVRTASVHSDASALMDMKVLDGNALTSMSVGLELTTVTLVLVVRTSQVRTVASAKEGTRGMDGTAQVSSLQCNTKL